MSGNPGGGVLIVGATSDIARAIARTFAAHGHSLILAARDMERCALDAEDLRLRYGVAVEVRQLDVTSTQTFEAFIVQLKPIPDIAVCVVGLLGEQKDNERSPAGTIEILRTNFEGPAVLLGMLANAFEQRGSGTLIGIGSVAGDRGRASNYIYGSAKAGFSAFLSGLRNRLVKRGVHVITVKPGFVDTRMLAGLNTPGLLTAQPDEVGKCVYAAWRRKRDIVYVRPIWRIVMLIIRHIPERIFKRLSI